MRLIDADELCKDIVERGAQLSGCYSAGIARYMDRMLAHVLAEVDTAPTVDAVPVVRCKDCKFSNWYTGGDGRPYNYCTELERGGFEEADYCSFRERRDDE